MFLSICLLSIWGIQLNVNCSEILVYEKYSGSGSCTSYELAYTHFFFQSEEDMYCSNFLKKFKDSVGVGAINSTHLNFTIFKERHCVGEISEIHIVPIETCITDLLGEDLGYFAKFSFRSNGTFSAEVIGEGSWIDLGGFQDDNCQNYSISPGWNREFIKTARMNPLFSTPFLDGQSPWPYFIRDEDNSSQLVVKKCNTSHVYQFFYSPDSSEEHTVLDEVGVVYLESGQHNCFPNHDGLKYSYTCTDGNTNPEIPTVHKDYYGELFFWNPDCRGEPFTYYEHDQALCKKHDVYFAGGTRNEYYVDSSGEWIRGFYWQNVKELETANCDEENLMLLYYRKIPPGTDTCLVGDDGIEMCSEKSMCRITTREFETYHQFGRNYYILLFHEEDCEYMNSHPLEFDRYRTERKSEAAWLRFYHYDVCVSHHMYRNLHIFDDHVFSFYGKCVDGEFHYEVFEGDDSCFGPSQNHVGDYCIDDPVTGNYYSFTCLPIHCNGLPETAPEVCGGHGACTNENECDCDRGYEGVFCDDVSEYSVIGLTSGERATIILSILLPLLFLFLLLCCLCCCCLFICFGVVLLLVCSVFSVTSLAFGQKKRLKRFSELKDFDMLLQEQKADRDSSIAHLRVNTELFQIPFDEIKVDQLIGEGGSSSVVFKAFWAGRMVAFKCFKTRMLCSSQESYDDFEKEVRILASISHPNIVRFFGATMNPPRVGILMEFCENGDLDQFLNDFGRKFQMKYPAKEKMRLLTEILGAFVYLQKRNIIHRDLKLENVLIDSLLSTRLMDFGLSKMCNKLNSQKTKNIGTELYMAPELINGDDYDFRVDVFAFGILCFVLITENRIPYGANTGKVEMKVASDPNYRPSTSQMKICLSETAQEFLWLVDVAEKCWSHSKEQRYTFEELHKMFVSRLTGTNSLDLMEIGQELDLVPVKGNFSVVSGEEEGLSTEKSSVQEVKLLRDEISDLRSEVGGLNNEVKRLNDLASMKDRMIERMEKLNRMSSNLSTNETE